MRRGTLVASAALALPCATACGTQEWGFYDPTPEPAAEASLDADGRLEAEAVDALDEENDVATAADGACDPDGARCPISCAGGAPCPDDAPVCAQPRSICEGCRSNQDCDNARSGPLCGQNGACLPECGPDRSCPQSRPHCSHGRCVS